MKTLNLLGFLAFLAAAIFSFIVGNTILGIITGVVAVVLFLNLPSNMKVDTKEYVKALNSAIFTDSFTRQAIEKLGLASLPRAEQESMVEQMKDSVSKRVAANLLQNLSSSDKKEFNRLVEQKNTEKLRAFLKSREGNYGMTVEETIADFFAQMSRTISDLDSVTK